MFWPPPGGRATKTVLGGVPGACGGFWAPQISKPPQNNRNDFGGGGGLSNPSRIIEMISGGACCGRYSDCYSGNCYKVTATVVATRQLLQGDCYSGRYSDCYSGCYSDSYSDCYKTTATG